MVLTAFLLAVGVQSRADFLMQAADYARRLGVPFDTTRAQILVDDIGTQVAEGERRFYFRKDGLSMGYLNTGLGGRLRTTKGNPSGFRIQTAAHAIARGAELSDLFSDYRGVVPKTSLDLSDEERAGFGGQVELVYEWHPYGYPSDGWGNRLLLSFARSDGELISVNDDRGWSYDAPDLRLTTEQAEALAASHLPKGTFVSRLSYSPGLGDSEAERRNFATKRCRLYYSVSVEKTSVAIDAETGEYAGTASAGLLPANARLKPKVKAQNGPRPGLPTDMRKWANSAGIMGVRWDNIEWKQAGERRTAFLSKRGIPECEIHFRGTHVADVLMPAHLSVPAHPIRTADDARRRLVSLVPALARVPMKTTLGTRTTIIAARNGKRLVAVANFDTATGGLTRLNYPGPER